MEEPLYIQGVRVKEENREDYQYVSAIYNTEVVHFKEPITFFVGENGTGKSTLLEAIAVAYGFNPEGGSLQFRFQTRETHSQLYEDIRLIKGYRHAKDGFFLRAESFYNVASYIDDSEALQQGLLDSYGGKSLHEQSHGESFLNLIIHRFRKDSIFILDEPEAALSPQRQLSLLVVMNELIEQGCQFIIATHSPILLAIQNATIYSFDKHMIKEISYYETDTYRITKAFLENPESFLDKLFSLNEEG